MQRIPFYFGATEKSLLGWYHRPANHNAHALGAVICPPLGHEYNNSHRTLRHLADAVAHLGLHVLRFDYHGTGDSGGCDEDPGRLPAWLDSIRCAQEALRRQSGVEQVGLIGLRMGASLAAIIAEEQEVPFLINWAPVLRGRAYVRELRALHLTSDRRFGDDVQRDDYIDAGGYIYTAETTADLSRIDLLTRSPRANKIFIGNRDDLANDLSLGRQWAQSGLDVTQCVLPGYAGMMSNAQSTVLPSQAIAQLVEWLSHSVLGGAGTTCLNHSRAGQWTCPPEITEIQIGVARETLVRFGPDGKRFGISCQPQRPAAEDLPWIVLSNSGANHHVGPSRLYVQLARDLAKAGFSSIRFDFPGLGDSAADTADQENLVYQPNMTAELVQVVNALAAQHQSQSYVLMGLCSGAYASFHASIEMCQHAIKEVVLINPLSFYWKQGMSLESSPVEHFRQWKQYQASLRDPSRWLKVLRGKVNLFLVIGTIWKQLTLWLDGKLPGKRGNIDSGNISADSPAASPQDIVLEAHRIYRRRMTHDLLACLRSGRQLSFVFSRADPGYELLTMFAGKLVRKLVKQQQIKIHFIEEADHTFSKVVPRLELIGLLVAHMKERHGTES